MPAELALAWRLARRDLRAGLGRFRLVLLCLGLGVFAIGAVGSITSAVVAGLEGNARALLGGDLEVRAVYQPVDGAALDRLDALGTPSTVASLRTMARAGDGDARRSFVELKAVDGAYPLYGELRLDPPMSPSDAFGRGPDGRFGAAVDPILPTRLGLKLGDTIEVGEVRLELRATIRREPDGGTSAFALGPRVLVGAPTLAASRLVQPATLVAFETRLRLDPGAGEAAAVAASLREAWGNTGWRVRDFGDAAPSTRRFIERLGLFLSLIGLSALLVGGVGIGNAVDGYLRAKTTTIAILKSVGAPTRLLFAVYLMEVLAIAAIGIAGGLALAAAAPFVAAGPLGGFLPADIAPSIDPAPLAEAAGFGLLVTLAFALQPLARAGNVPAAALFRGDDHGRRRRSVWPTLVAALAASLLATLAILGAEDRRVAAWFVVGVALAFVVFRAAALLIAMAARRVPRPRRTSLRLALAGVYRPGAPTASIVLSLGLGLTVLVTIALVEGNLVREVRQHLPDAAPSFFFIDIQRDQADAFDRLMRETPGVVAFERVPHLRGRITRLKGIAAERAPVAPEAQWGVRSERGITYAPRLPPGSRLVAGSWWPADYRGPPLVSFEAELARGMGLSVGDEMTLNVLGREVTATVANLRAIDWQSLELNFTVVFAPGFLEAAPQTFLATARASDAAAEERLLKAVGEAFPNLTTIRVRDALETVGRVFESLAAALRATASVALVAGVLVLAGAVAAGRRRRLYEAVILKVVGATRVDLAQAFLAEFGLLGGITAVLAALLGTLAGYLVLTQAMRTEFQFLPWEVGGTAALAVLLTMVIGFLGTWQALGAKAAPHLRNE